MVEAESAAALTLGPLGGDERGVLYFAFILIDWRFGVLWVVFRAPKHTTGLRFSLKTQLFKHGSALAPALCTLVTKIPKSMHGFLRWGRPFGATPDVYTLTPGLKDLQRPRL